MSKKRAQNPPRAGWSAGDRLHPELERSLRGDDDGAVAQAEIHDEGVDDDVLGPLVVVARLGDLARPNEADPRLADHADRPVWFLREDEADDAEVFVRLREGPMPRPTIDRILARVRAFAADESDALQELLGSASSLELGFHTSASYDEVVASFEEDGFDVIVGAVRAGALLDDDTDR